MIKVEYSSLSKDLTVKVDILNFLSGRDKIALFNALATHLGVRETLAANTEFLRVFDDVAARFWNAS